MILKQGDIVVEKGQAPEYGDSKNEYLYTYRIVSVGVLSETINIEMYSTVYIWDRNRIGKKLGSFPENQFTKIKVSRQGRSHPLTQIFKNNV